MGSFKHFSCTALAIAGITIALPAQGGWLENRLHQMRALVREAPVAVSKILPQPVRSRPRTSAALGYAAQSASLASAVSFGNNVLRFQRALAGQVQDSAAAIARTGDPRNAVAVALAAAIRDARARHYPGSRPLPPRVIAALSGTIPATTLKRARYVVRDPRASLPTLVNGAQKYFAGNDHAVVADDVIVFSTLPSMDTPKGIEWWAHEVHHVHQYGVWGIDRFARTYVRDNGKIERRADAVAKRAVARAFAQMGR